MASEVGRSEYLTTRSAPNRYGVVLQYRISRGDVGRIRAASSSLSTRDLPVRIILAANRSGVYWVL